MDALPFWASGLLTSIFILTTIFSPPDSLCPKNARLIVSFPRYTIKRSFLPFKWPQINYSPSEDVRAVVFPTYATAASHFHPERHCRNSATTARDIHHKGRCTRRRRRRTLNPAINLRQQPSQKNRPISPVPLHHSPRSLPIPPLTSTRLTRQRPSHSPPATPTKNARTRWRCGNDRGQQYHPSFTHGLRRPLGAKTHRRRTAHRRSRTDNLPCPHGCVELYMRRIRLCCVPTRRSV